MTNSEVHLNIVEVRKPEIDATLVANRSPAAGAPCCVPPRHEAGRAVGHAAGRRGYPDQLRRPSRRCGNRATEWYREGRVPLHTLRADVDYGTRTAQTAYGTNAASRSGSSRVKSWSMIRWHPNAVHWKAGRPAVVAANRIG
jgi:small subunit ribosomal protein S3